MKQHDRRLTLEPLEDRTLMSTCHVTRLSDTGTGFGFRGDLRYCINKVNANPGPDAIDFTVTGTINLTGVLPDLASDIDIQGPGEDVLTVRRNTGGDYRIFTIPLGKIVGIFGLSISNGNNPNGGGIYSAGRLKVSYSTITANGPTTGGAGGGILNDDTGVLSLDHSTVTANGGGGISGFAGGGIYNEGTALVSFSTIADNFALGGDAFICPAAGGGGIHNRGTLRLENSTVLGNVARVQGSNDDNLCAYGGGIYNWGGAHLFNSTIANNLAEQLGSSDFEGAYGGGIFSAGNPSGALLTIDHSTIAGNANATSGSNSGGGIYGPINTFIRNTIVAGNTSPSAPDLFATLASSSYNLFGDSDGVTGYDDTDLLDVDPLLGPLAPNGGPTETIALLPGSPAIDAGDNTDAPEWDQRGPGYPRIVNGTIDIGAFEVQATGAPTVPDFLAVLITADFQNDEYEGRS